MLFYDKMHKLHKARDHTFSALSVPFDRYNWKQKKKILVQLLQLQNQAHNSTDNSFSSWK